MLSFYCPCLETFSKVVELSHRCSVNAQAPAGDHGYTACHPDEQCAEKHTFVPYPAAVALFTKLYIETHARFKSVLSTRQQEVMEMRRQLQSNKEVRKAYGDITQPKEPSYELLKMIVYYFIRSKQKQLLRRHGLSTSQQSVALRSSLRQAPNLKYVAPSDSSMGKSLPDSNQLAQAITQLTSQQSPGVQAALESQTVSGLKSL